MGARPHRPWRWDAPAPAMRHANGTTRQPSPVLDQPTVPSHRTDLGDGTVAQHAHHTARPVGLLVSSLTVRGTPAYLYVTHSRHFRAVP